MESKKDCKTILEKIENHPEKNEFIELYIKGPPNNEGFMWWRDPPEIFTIVKEWVLNIGYESSSYGIMHRMIQGKIREKYEGPE
jgi:hypothetical protein